MTVDSTKHCWVGDLKTGTFLANSRERVRVMGVVTSVGSFPPGDYALVSQLTHHSSNPRFKETDSDTFDSKDLLDENLPLVPPVATTPITPKEKIVSITIDDGTDSIDVCAPHQMIAYSPPCPAIEIGRTYDCILKLLQNATAKRWFADVLVKIDNPIDEHYRWLELSHHENLRSGSTSAKTKHSSLCHDTGFPTRKRNVSEVYRLIRLHTQFQEDEREEQARSNRKGAQKRNYPRWNNTRQPLQSQRRSQQNGIINRNKMGQPKISRGSATNPLQQHKTSTSTNPPSLTGLLLKDLALVLQKSQKDIHEMTEDLQMEGKIYQNERGEYLPL